MTLEQLYFKKRLSKPLDIAETEYTLNKPDIKKSFNGLTRPSAQLERIEEDELLTAITKDIFGIKNSKVAKLVRQFAKNMKQEKQK